MVNQPLIVPSILAGNHANLSSDLREIEQIKSVRWLHLDIMDGHFVPNLTFGPQTVADLRVCSSLFFDTHLMLSNPHQHIEAFARAGSDNITVHVEPSYPIRDTLRKIRDLGCQCGISLNPDTPVSSLEPFLEEVDLILAMTVQPGFGGQAFHKSVLEKVAILNGWRQKHSFSWRIEVDGGVDLFTGKLCRRMGVDTLVAGTAFFKAEDRRAFVEELML